MNNHTEHDKINEELTKAFFSKTLEGNIAQKDPKPEQKPSKKFSTRKILIISIFCLVVFATTTFFLIKSSAFNLNIDLFQKDENSAFTIGSKRLNFFPDPPLSDKTKDIKTSYKNVSVLFDFEYDSESWEIPDWAMDKSDYIATGLNHVTGLGSTGKGSLEIQTDFPGSFWSGAIIELAQYISFEGFEKISGSLSAADGFIALVNLPGHLFCHFRFPQSFYFSDSADDSPGGKLY